MRKMVMMANKKKKHKNQKEEEEEEEEEEAEAGKEISHVDGEVRVYPSDTVFPFRGCHP